MSETEVIRIEYDVNELPVCVHHAGKSFSLRRHLNDPLYSAVLRLCREISSAKADCERPDYEDEIAEIKRLKVMVQEPLGAEICSQRLRKEQAHLAELLKKVDAYQATVTFELLRCLNRMDFPDGYMLRVRHYILQCAGRFTFNVWSVKTMANIAPSRQPKAIQNFVNGRS